MAKVRKDTKGRVLHKGEDYHKGKGLYRYSYTDPLKNRRCIYAKDLPELREKIKQLQKDQLDGLDTYVLGNADIDFAFDRYMTIKTELRSSTKSNYLYTYNRYVRNGFGKRKITDVRYSDVVLFYGDLSSKGLSLNTIDTVHSVLFPTFQLAVRDNIIRNNPAEGAMAEIKKKWKAGVNVRHALSVNEEQAFFKALDEPENTRWKSLFTVMFGTGCRIGEIIGLRWEDVDFENGVIIINHDITYCMRPEKGNKCEYEVSLPKTKAGIRKIPMLEKVRKSLEEERRIQDKYGNSCIMEIDGMTGFIFTNRFGRIFNQGGINKVIKRIVSDYNAREELNARRAKREPVFIPKFSCHIARHTFCSRLCENETNIKVIQSVMGHKDIQTTLDIYAEISEQKMQDVFNQLNNKDVI